jgi:hypothetical protein
LGRIDLEEKRDKKSATPYMTRTPGFLSGFLRAGNFRPRGIETAAEPVPEEEQNTSGVTEVAGQRKSEPLPTRPKKAAAKPRGRRPRDEKQGELEK